MLLVGHDTCRPVTPWLHGGLAAGFSVNHATAADYFLPRCEWLLLVASTEGRTSAVQGPHREAFLLGQFSPRLQLAANHWPCDWISSIN